jgi:hypothetical protein
MSNSEENYIPLVRKNNRGRVIEDPVISEEAYEDFFSRKPIGPNHLPPLPRFESLPLESSATLPPRPPPRLSNRLPSRTPIALASAPLASAPLGTRPSPNSSVLRLPHTTISSLRVTSPSGIVYPRPPPPVRLLPHTVVPYVNTIPSNSPLISPHLGGKKKRLRKTRRKLKKTKKSRKHLRR